MVIKTLPILTIGPLWLTNVDFFKKIIVITCNVDRFSVCDPLSMDTTWEFVEF